MHVVHPHFLLAKSFDYFINTKRFQARSGCGFCNGCRELEIWLRKLNQNQSVANFWLRHVIGDRFVQLVIKLLLGHYLSYVFHPHLLICYLGKNDNMTKVEKKFI